MRDIALLAILLCFVSLTLYRPWAGVLGLAVLSVMHPHGYASGFMQHFPVYAILFAVTCFAWAVQYMRRGRALEVPWDVLLDWRIMTLLLLWVWFGVTTYFSLSYWDAFEKYQHVIKIVPPLVLTLLLVDTRDKLHYLIVVIALSVLLVAVKGGYWALMTQFSDRVYGPPGSPYHGNNEFAVVVTMAIPLLVIWLNQTQDKWMRIMILVGIALCYGSVISSWSRGAMLGLSVVTLLLVWHSNRKWLVLPLLTILVAGYVVQLPGDWFERMQTFATLEGDASAQGRLEVWRIGFEFAKHRPVMGGGFDAWIVLTPLRDWHNTYVELLAEHGFVGLAIWLVLLLGTLASLTRLGWRAARAKAYLMANYSFMLRASLLAYAVGSFTLGITYWELPYHLIVMSVILNHLASLELAKASGSGIWTSVKVSN